MVVYADTNSRLRPRPSTFFCVSRCLDCTFATFDFKSTSRSRFTDPLLFRCYRYPIKPHARSYCVHVEFRHSYAFSVSFTEPRLMSTPAETESQPRNVLSRTPPPVYADVFSISENSIAPVQFTLQTIDRFLIALLSVYVICFLLLNLIFALYVYFNS